MSRYLKYIDENSIKLIVIFTIVAVVFIMIGHKYREQIQTKLKKKFVTIPAFDLDWWSMTHFLLFAVFGFIKPNYPLTFMAIGAIWEIFEDGLSSDHTTHLVDCKPPKNTFIKKLMCNGFEDGYWYGKWDDILCNTFGYLVGASIRTSFF